jgi:hypothetical protein
MRQFRAILKAVFDTFIYYFFLIIGALMLPFDEMALISNGTVVIMAGAAISIPFFIWRVVLRLYRLKQV